MEAETLTATVWLGAKLSVVAAVLAVVLPLLGDVSQAALVTAVATAAFTASWVQTGRLERGGTPLLVRHAPRRGARVSS
jgi:hypothetical protein